MNLHGRGNNQHTPSFSNHLLHQCLFLLLCCEGCPKNWKKLKKKWKFFGDIRTEKKLLSMPASWDDFTSIIYQVSVSKINDNQPPPPGRPDLGFRCSKQKPPIAGDLYCQFHMQEQHNILVTFRLVSNKMRKSEQQAKPFD